MRSVMVRLLMIFLMCAASTAQAAMVLNTTRIILDNGRNETTYGIRNLSSHSEFLAQSWLTPMEGDGTVENFSLTPQLVRVVPNAEQSVRILYEGVGASQDNETMFWLNVQEIPKRDEMESGLQVAVLQRIKVFYRPKSIEGSSITANSNIEWRIANGKLKVNNPSRFHVTVINLASTTAKLKSAFVLAPGQKKEILISDELNVLHKEGKAEISYSTVNDYGAHDKYYVPLIGDQAVKGQQR